MFHWNVFMGQNAFNNSTSCYEPYLDPVGRLLGLHHWGCFGCNSDDPGHRLPCPSLWIAGRAAFDCQKCPLPLLQLHRDSGVPGRHCDRQPDDAETYDQSGNTPATPTIQTPNRQQTEQQKCTFIWMTKKRSIQSRFSGVTEPWEICFWCV